MFGLGGGWLKMEAKGMLSGMDCVSATCGKSNLANAF